ncbi:MAG: hypothetical protein ACYTEP_07605 [Planctomycetota bacterium]|jgi:hypothetical protein
MEPAQSTQVVHLREDYFNSLENLRGCLTQVLSAEGVADSSPQEISQELNLSKNLAWKITKLVRERPDIESLALVPGSSGFQKLLDAMEQGGSDPHLLAATKEAFAGFQEMIKRHAGDRSALQLLLESLSSNPVHSPGLLESRRLAYLGNSGILGIQARVRFATFFLAPNRDRPDTLDSAFLGGLMGVRRFRPSASWVLTRQSICSDDGSTIQEPQRSALDPRFPGPGPMLLGDYCTRPIPEVTARQAGQTRIHELAAGPIGNTGVGNVCFGHRTMADLPRYCDEHNRNGEFHLYLASPVEHLQLDVVLHKDLEVQDLLQATMHLNLTQDPLPAHERQEQDYLPISEEMRLLHGGRHSFSTPRVERYGGMVDMVLGQMGWRDQDFRSWRLEMEFPPLPATLIIGFPLQEKP